MRKPVRPFIREYKSRPSRSLIPKDMIDSSSNAPVKRFEELDAANSIHRTVSEASHTRFRDAGEHDGSLKVGSPPKAPTGRILPCLLEQSNHPDGQPEKVRRARRRVIEVRTVEA